MPERARAVVLASTGTGDIIPDATVTVRNPGTTVNITDTIFANDDPDTTQLTNGVFKTDARGLAIFYLTNQKRVDVLFTKAGVTSVTIPVDVQKSSLVSGYDTIQEEGTAVTARAKLNFIGTGVTAADDAANTRTNVTITGATLADAAPPAIAAAGSIGVSTDSAREDHTHSGSAYQALSDQDRFVGARAWLSTTPQSIANDTWTAIALNAESFDSDALHDNVTNPSRLTIPAGKAGKYVVAGAARFAGNLTGLRAVCVRKNNIEKSQVELPASSAATDYSLTVTDIIDCAAGDYLELFVLQRSGAALNVMVDERITWLSCHLAGI